MKLPNFKKILKKLLINYKSKSLLKTKLNFKILINSWRPFNLEKNNHTNKQLKFLDVLKIKKKKYSKKLMTIILLGEKTQMIF